MRKNMFAVFVFLPFSSFFISFLFLDFTLVSIIEFIYFFFAKLLMLLESWDAPSWSLCV